MLTELLFLKNQYLHFRIMKNYMRKKDYHQMGCRFLLAAVLLASTTVKGQFENVRLSKQPKTYCNPLNVSYRFSIPNPGCREAADPVLQTYQGKYFLFASKSAGYWYSTDMVKWIFVPISNKTLPIEDYAPTTFEYKGWLYYVGSVKTGFNAMLYKSKAPEKGDWVAVKEIKSDWDPSFLVENDSLILYAGCSNKAPIFNRIFDANTFEIIKDSTALFTSETQNHGFERPGDKNETNRNNPWVEGSWINKYKGTYYLQYAVPGTSSSSYCNGLYTATSPQGPFVFAPYSPVSYKPEGFIAAAGHGAMADIGKNNFQSVQTMRVSVVHGFERRVGLFRAGIDKDGYLYTDTYLGDYPTFSPLLKNKNSKPDWMLLSAQKKVEVSSNYQESDGKKLTDCDVRTFWSAATANEGEYASVDLESIKTIHAIQVNFAEAGATEKPNFYKGMREVVEAYKLYASMDGKKWSLIVDKSQDIEDHPHDYLEFEAPFKARFLKVENVKFTAGLRFSIREIRVFGFGDGKLPEKTTGLKASRNEKDACKAILDWTKNNNANGYVIRFGVSPKKLYNSIEIIGNKTHYDLNALNKGQKYYFQIDAYNEKGITKGEEVVEFE